MRAQLSCCHAVSRKTVKIAGPKTAYASSPTFLVRYACPSVVHAFGKCAVGELFRADQRLSGTEAVRRLTGSRGRGVQVVAVDDQRASGLLESSTAGSRPPNSAVIRLRSGGESPILTKTLVARQRTAFSCWPRKCPHERATRTPWAQSTQPAGQKDGRRSGARGSPQFPFGLPQPRRHA